jgi:hypothetical protein
MRALPPGTQSVPDNALSQQPTTTTTGGQNIHSGVRRRDHDLPPLRESRTHTSSPG